MNLSFENCRDHVAIYRPCTVVEKNGKTEISTKIIDKSGYSQRYSFFWPKNFDLIKNIDEGSRFQLISFQTYRVAAKSGVFGSILLIQILQI